MSKAIKKSEREKNIKRYEVPEDVLTLILTVESLSENMRSLPLEYRKLTRKYVNDMKELVGIEDAKYKKWAITDYKHLVEIEYEKEYE